MTRVSLLIAQMLHAGVLPRELRASALPTPVAPALRMGRRIGSYPCPGCGKPISGNKALCMACGEERLRTFRAE